MKTICCDYCRCRCCADWLLSAKPMKQRQQHATVGKKLVISVKGTKAINGACGFGGSYGGARV